MARRLPMIAERLGRHEEEKLTDSSAVRPCTILKETETESPGLVVPESRTIRDPIHRFIELNEQEAELMDTRPFQRLRHLRQLAFAYLVYPSATHTRFEHSIGVCHVAGLLARSLQFDPDQTKLVRIAALLHDLGHRPFSHVSEEALERYADRSKLPPKTEKIHEFITAILINQDPEICRCLSSSLRERVVTALQSGHGEPVVRNVLSGPIDAVKQDYLLRDSYFCGVQYGVFDLPQLHQVLRNVVDPTGDRHLMVEPDGVHALEQFVLAKYYLTTQVVRHRIRLITDQMLIRAISLGIEEDRIQELADLYTFDGTDEFIRRYATWGDTRLLQTFAGEKFEGTLSHRLFSGLLHRHLLKLVYREPLTLFRAEAREALQHISRPENQGLRRKLEGGIAECIQKGSSLIGEPGRDLSHFVILHSYTFKSVKDDSKNDETPILINKGTSPIYFEDASTLFQSINGKLSETHVEVYAPVCYASPADRRTLRNRLRGPLTTILEMEAGEQ